MSSPDLPQNQAANPGVASAIEHEDMTTLAEILEHEKQSHHRKRSLCFAMFVISFVSLILALVLAGVRVGGMMLANSSDVQIGNEIWMLQGLGPLAAIAVSFFSAWWGVQNCLNSIERTLFAARAQRHHLFAKFLEQIQCADQKKKRMWLELVKSFVN